MLPSGRDRQPPAYIEDTVSLQPGQMLSHYRVVEQIGEGGMGVVYWSTDSLVVPNIS